MEIHQALTRSSSIQNVFPRHEQVVSLRLRVTLALLVFQVFVLQPPTLAPPNLQGYQKTSST
ncbi:hypothetical protein G4B88_023215 [Cannabis sativa]|uniref:Uncharacterized protein n=1 Tax=Cannabis sativa TaxID=3483 RepID=A0A7J6DYL9_CANSA|nr:hypothetical protein G4B88_023215 [Cannabis sativa]